MTFDWIERQIDAVIALLTSGQVMLVLGSLLAPSAGRPGAAERRCTVPWQSAYWTLYPLGVAIAVVAAILLLWPGHPRWALALFLAVSCAGAAWLALGVSGRVRRARRIVVPGLAGGRQEYEVDPATSGQRLPPARDGASSSSATAPATGPTS